MMDNNDKITRELATLTEQGRWVFRELTEIKNDVKHIKESHLAFKWKIVGASSILGFLAALMTDFFRR